MEEWRRRRRRRRRRKATEGTFRGRTEGEVEGKPHSLLIRENRLFPALHVSCG